MKTTIFLLIVLPNLLFAQDSIKTFIKENAWIYTAPNADSCTYNNIPVFTDVYVIREMGDFYEIAGVGFVKKYYVYLNDDLKLWEEGMDKQEIEDYKRQKTIAVEKKKNDRIQRLNKRFGNINAQRILERKVWIGMTKEMASESWGEPEHINRTITASGSHEQWVYSSGQYLYFDDGILTTIQD